MNEFFSFGMMLLEISKTNSGRVNFHDALIAFITTTPSHCERAMMSPRDGGDWVGPFIFEPPQGRRETGKIRLGRSPVGFLLAVK